MPKGPKGEKRPADVIGNAVRSHRHGSKARDNAVPISHKHAARDDLVEWKLNGIRVSE